MVQDPFKVASEVEAAEYDGPRFGDFVGEVLLIKPTAYDNGLTGKYTKPGETYDRVTADVVVLNLKDPSKSEPHSGMWITQGRIIGKTKGEVDGMVLAKLVRPEPTRSEPNPAYDLDDPSPAEVEAAREFLKGAEEPPF